MEIWNHFTFRKDMHPLTANYILNNHIEYEIGDIICSVDISEKDPHWEKLLKLIETENNSYLSETKFNQSDCSSAKWLTMRSRWYYDYPQPESQYTNITYTKDFLCANRDCGIELIQKDSFRFKKTPKWGKRNFCMTNWVYDELFISSKAKDLLETSELQGFSFVTVNNKTGKEALNDIFQMKIPHILSEGIADLSSRINDIYVCPLCGRKKLRPNERGMFVFKSEAFENAPDFVKSSEIFGGGASASRLILVSQKAYKYITENKLDSSLVFEPIQLS